MNQLLKKTAILVLAAVTAFAPAACGGDGYREGPADTVEATSYEWVTEASLNNTDVPDSSEISDYPGEHKIDLVAWNTTATGNFATYESTNDIVSPEIERITGVSIDKEELRDNRGNTAEARFNNFLTTGNLPDIAFGGGWLDTEAVWDLTDLVEEYCPTIMARMPDAVWDDGNVNGGEEGKVYAIPYGLGNVSLSTIDPYAPVDKTVMFTFRNEMCPYILVREDILKDAYPEALTTADLDRIYKEQGYFTEEQLFDVHLTSAEQFRTEFLPKIAGTIKNSGDKYKINAQRYVTPMLVTAGSDHDTWDFMGKLIPGLLGAGANSFNSNFSYWDTSTQQIESMLYQDFYKNEVYEWAKMIYDGTVVSDTQMNTNYSTIQSEYNSGYYAIGYLSSSMPSSRSCQWKDMTTGETRTVNYRKLYLDIPTDWSRFAYMGSGEPAVSSVKFLKSRVREDELPQLLRWLDFLCSRTADLLYAWGPETAGLFDEDENGVRTYKDSEIADQMVYSTAVMGQKVITYNLANGTGTTASQIFPFCYGAGSISHPKCTYDLSSLSDLTETFYSAEVVLTEEAEKFIGIKIRPSFHTWTDADLDGVEEIWGSRDIIEDALKQLLLAGSSQAAFDRAWTTLQTELTSHGWTKGWFNGQLTNAFLNINRSYLDLFYTGE